MNARYIRYALVTAFAVSMSACGPSKDTMCREIAAGRNRPDVEAETYIKCLNASDEWVKEAYKELKARQQKQ